MNSLPLIRRSRRNRCSPSIRDLVQENRVCTKDLIQPLFIIDGEGAPEPISSMPGVFRHNIKDIVLLCKEAVSLGIPGVALFPYIDAALKDDLGAHALDKSNILFHAIRAVKAECPGLVVITDIALDPYTLHGHDGVLTEDGAGVDNDRSVSSLVKLAVCAARAGADWVAPSDMMDGRVGAIRKALDAEGFIQTGILAYAAKFASAYYGPFREAVGSDISAGNGPSDKLSYQLNPANRREAIFDALLDEKEGADVLMVKPAGPYLDVIMDLKRRSDLPLAAYQVSGEYAQIHAAAQLGWLDLRKTRDESLLAIKRAGADIILTYFAMDMARDLND